MTKYTPTQQRILALLKDGNPHTAKEILKCFNDEDQSLEHVAVVIFRLRKLLPESQRIIGERGPDRVFAYRHVRLMRVE